MQQLTTTNRTAPWIGIGVSGEWKDYRDALRAASLDFDVETRPAKVETFVDPTVVMYDDIPNTRATVRLSDEKVLGAVSDKYHVVQNSAAFSLLEPFTQSGGVITNAGMTEQGLCFMVLRMRRKVLLGDDWDFDVLCTNSFNGRFPLGLIITPLRIICQNMYRGLLNKHDGLLNVRHLRYAQDKLLAAQTATAGLLMYSQLFEDSLENLRHRELDDIDAVVEMLFPYPKPGGKREWGSRKRVDGMREEFMDRYWDAPDNRRFQGSMLGFVNAYYDYLSHRDPGKNMPGSWADRRFSSLVSGDAVNQKLLKEVLA